jgi:hypothetical protein
VGKYLLPVLASIFINRQRSDSERSLAAGALADYAADNPSVLVGLLADSDRKYFATFFSALKKQGSLAIKSLEEELYKPPAEGVAEAKVDFASRNANLAIALVMLSEGDQVWPLLRQSRDPSVRSYIIDRASTLGVDPSRVSRRLDEEGDVSVRRALILCLGEFGTESLPTEKRKMLIPKMLALYRDDADAGIHAAAEWLLRKWNQADEILRADRLLTGDKADTRRKWYVNGQGQTLRKLPEKPTRSCT